MEVRDRVGYARRCEPSEVLLDEADGMESRCVVAQLSALRLDEVSAALRFSLGCDGS